MVVGCQPTITVESTMSTEYGKGRFSQYLRTPAPVSASVVDGYLVLEADGIRLAVPVQQAQAALEASIPRATQAA